ncbi:MAG: NAD(P)-dependent oxidoreductase [Pseudomonadota bacterium]
MRVFITGGSGCVGHYLVHRFLEDPETELVLLLRRPERLTLPNGSEGRVTVLKGDLRSGPEHREALQGIDLGLLAATAWGGKDTFDITVGANLTLTDLLIEGGAKKIVYFASASVLARDGSLLDQAREIGTEYIQAKYRLVEEIETRSDRARLTGFFPTVIFGGGAAPVGAPLSHFARMLFENQRWLPLLRHLSAPGRLHLIHPGDIATLAWHFAHQPETEGYARVVLGNAPVRVDDLIGDLARAAGRRHRPLLRVTDGRLRAFAKLFRARLSEWDWYCATHTDQSYPTAIMPGDLGLKVEMPDMAAGLKSIGFPGNPNA